MSKLLVPYLLGGNRLAENGARFSFLHTLLFCFTAVALLYSFFQLLAKNHLHLLTKAKYVWSSLSLELRTEEIRVQADATSFLLGESRLAENDARFSFSRALLVLIAAVILVYIVFIQLFRKKLPAFACICLILLCNEFQYLVLAEGDKKWI